MTPTPEQRAEATRAVKEAIDIGRELGADVTLSVALLEELDARAERIKELEEASTNRKGIWAAAMSSHVMHCPCVFELHRRVATLEAALRQCERTGSEVYALLNDVDQGPRAGLNKEWRLAWSPKVVAAFSGLWDAVAAAKEALGQ